MRHRDLIESMEVDFTRQRDWYDPYESTHRVTMVGCGGIGSPTAVLLSKLGIPYLTLIDPDIIEPHNLPNQFFPLKMVGKPKVAVLKALCEMFGTSEVTTHQKYVGEVADVLHGTVLTGLDSMAARKEVWKVVKDNPKCNWLVDGRLNGMGIVLWAVDLRDDWSIGIYESEALYSDEEADELPCTGRGVIDVAGFVASMITRTVRMIATGQTPDLVTSLSTASMKLWIPFADTPSSPATDPASTELVTDSSTSEVLA